MKLRCYIHDERALEVETRAGPDPEGEIWRGPALRKISAGWDRTPDTYTIEHWLRGAIPENGCLETFERKAGEFYTDRGIRTGAGAMPDWLWANADWEYPGAIRFARIEDGGDTEKCHGYDELSEKDLAARLREATAEAERTRRGVAVREHNPGERNASLSGARGKIAVDIDDDARILLPRKGSLSTWIIKIEHRADWEGEAGTESVCQNALRLLGIEAAPTTTRIIDGIPVVMSKRSDRELVDGTPTARHQEDWLQVFGRTMADKYDRGVRSDSGYASLYAILKRYAAEPENEARRITKTLAAACAMVNGDLHRKNLAVQHARAGTPFAVRLAPIYDFSSQAGVPGATDRLIIRIGGGWYAHQIDKQRWLRLAKRARLDGGETVDIVREIANAAPEALAEARDQCRRRDEWHARATVEERIEATIGAARAYARMIGGGKTPGGQKEREEDRNQTHGEAARQALKAALEDHDVIAAGRTATPEAAARVKATEQTITNEDEAKRPPQRSGTTPSSHD